MAWHRLHRLWYQRPLAAILRGLEQPFATPAAMPRHRIPAPGGARRRLWCTIRVMQGGAKGSRGFHPAVQPRVCHPRLQHLGGQYHLTIQREASLRELLAVCVGL